MRFFYNSGFGFGFNGSFVGINNGSTINSNPAVLRAVSIHSHIDTINFGATGYYKRSFTYFDAKWYFLGGLGLDIYYANYYTKISYDAGDSYFPPKGPYANEFNQKYSSTAVGFHGVIELGVELTEHIPLFLQVYLPYVQFDKFSSSSEGTMQFNDGSRVKPLINGFIIQIGSWYTF